MAVRNFHPWPETSSSVLWDGKRRRGFGRRAMEASIMRLSVIIDVVVAALQTIIILLETARYKSRCVECEATPSSWGSRAHSDKRR